MLRKKMIFFIEKDENNRKLSKNKYFTYHCHSATKKNQILLVTRLLLISFISTKTVIRKKPKISRDLNVLATNIEMKNCKKKKREI